VTSRARASLPTRTQKIIGKAIHPATAPRPKGFHPASSRVYHPGPLLTSEAVLSAAIADLLRRDPKVIGTLLEISGDPPLRKSTGGFFGLASIVVSQQVSVASAEAIFGRLKQTIDPLEASSITAAPAGLLKACGLSRPKIQTLKAVAAAIETDCLSLERLSSMSPEAAHAELTAIPGIGPWTADIFLLFCLGHPDAWPAGDLALQEAAKMALQLQARPDTRQLQKIGERWRPWRGVAARILWTYYRYLKARPGIAL
jgi:DNA-3-methyladenine glycosylase II